MGLHFLGGTLQYTGSTPQSTNRHIRMVIGNGATLDASGANPNATLSFTRTGANINLFDTPGVRTLTLTGTNTGTNGFSILLADQNLSPTSVLKTGPGTWVLNGPDTNTATGSTTVLNGMLVLGKTNALAVSGQLILGDGSNQAVAQLGGTGGNQIVDTGIVSFGGQGVLRMNNLTETIAGLNGGGGTGIVENESGTPGTGTLTLNVPTATTQNFGGMLRDGDGAGIDGTLALTKVGGGTLVLFGLSTHTGATTVSGGTLTVTGSLTGATVNVNGAVVDGAGAIGGTVTIGNAGTVRSTGTLTGTVNVNSGGTLAGTSTTNGTVNVASGGHVSPAGPTAPGTLTIGTLSLSSGALIDLELGGVSDLVTITTAGGLVLNGGAFNLFDVGGLNPLSVNGTYVLLDYTANFTGLLGNLSIANSQVGKFYTIDDDAANTRITFTMSDTTVTEWNGSAATGLWTTNGNWTLSAPNAPGAVAKFGQLPAAPTAVAVNGAKTVGGILFDNVNSYTVSGGASDAITLSNGVAAASITVTSGNHLLAAPLTLVSSANATTAAGTTLTISGIISGSRSLIASGTGNTILSGTNSYTATTVSSGTLTIGNAGTTGTLGTGDVNISTGAALVFNRSDDLTVANNIFGSGAQVTKLGAGVLTLSGASNFATDAASALNLNAGTIKVGAASALGTAANLNFTGGSLDLNGNNVSIATLTGTTGGITDTALGAGPSVLTVTQSVATTFSGNIANGPTRAVAVTKSGNGALTLTGANAFSGPLTITNGAIIAAGGAGNIPIPSNVTFGNGTNPVFLIAGAFDPQFGANTAINFNNGSVNAKFLLRGSSQTIAGLDSTADPSITLAIVENDEAGSPGFIGAPGLATLTLNTTTDHSFAGLIRNQVGGGLNLVKDGPATQQIRNALIGINAISTLTINAGRMLFNYAPNGNVTNVLPATTGVVLNSGTLAFDGTETIAAVISGNGTILRQGTGTVRIDSANTFTGTTIIQDGTIEIGNDLALGNSIITMNGGIIRAAGALRNLANPVVVNNSFTLGRLTHLNGGLTLMADATITANNFDGAANNPSNISAVGGNFRLSLAQGPQGIGTGALVFIGQNTNSGGTTVTSGRVNVNAGAALANADLTVNGGELNLSNITQTITSLNGGGGTVNLIAGHSLLVDQSVASTFAGVLANSGSLTKSGPGTLTLAGTNTYSGSTTVNAGTLLVAGALNGTTAVSVAAGGTLGGTGTINAPAFTAIAAGGTLAPGVGAGTLTFLNAALNLGTGANYQYEAGPISDTTSLFGALSSLTITDTWTLNLANLGVIPNGLTFVLFDGDLSAPQLNSGLVGTPTIDYGATGWSGGIVTFDAAGNDIILSGVVPEPASIATLGAALALVAGLRRRRAA